MRHILDESSRSGATRAYQEVRRSNQAAQALYEHLGFTLAGVRRNYYTNPDEDALVLTRETRE
jgi:ribosomal-protein-alanine N-acetyltransferase